MEWEKECQKRQSPVWRGFGGYGGTRRTVVGCEAPILAGLEFRGFFDVPQKVSIKKSASYGFLWNRIENFGALSIAAMQ